MVDPVSPSALLEKLLAWDLPDNWVTEEKPGMDDVVTRHTYLHKSGISITVEKIGRNYDLMIFRHGRSLRSYGSPSDECPADLRELVQQFYEKVDARLKGSDEEEFRRFARYPLL